jgi:hypothetical protein
MSLQSLFEPIFPRFRTNEPSTPANRFVFGFVTPDGASGSVTISPTGTSFTEGLRDAEYLIYAERTHLTSLLDAGAPNRAALIDEITFRPDYPFSTYLLSIFLNAFDLSIPDLDCTAKRFDGPFPFPPRYPASENRFRLRQYRPEPLPSCDPEQLPRLIADDHPAWVQMAERAWQLAFSNLRQPEPGSGFIANFIDPAFNDNTYLWDSCFMVLFGRYGRRLFDFTQTLDNFYASQHDDGFICREINTFTGSGVFQSLDPRSTGPNLFAWTEWQCFQSTRDEERLNAVFPVLVAYHRWWKDWRTHPDGSYWTSGWGSGMDNQTRVPQSEFHHRHYTWVDATFQQALNCRMLLRIADVLGRHEFDAELAQEKARLREYVNASLWDEAAGFYLDRAPDGSLSTVRSIGTYWALLSDIVPADRALRLISHLEDPGAFNRPHRVPTQAFDSAGYNPFGGYWLGGVWAPTNAMVLCGLTACGQHALAHDIALNHVENVARVFAETGTLWENYAPESVRPGKPAGRDFVGWTGLSAISIPIEYVIGVQTTDEASALSWTIRLIERHGVQRHPIGKSGSIDLICAARQSADEPASVEISTDTSVTIMLTRGDRHRRAVLQPGTHHLIV